MQGLQERLIRIFAETTGFPAGEIPVDRPLLELGVGSLALVDAFRVIQEQFGVRPSIRRVFEEFSTVELFTCYMEELLKNRSEAPAPPPVRRMEGDRLPVGAAWRHLWFLASYSEGASAAYNEPAVIALNGPLDAGALSLAVRRVAARHEGLRARMQEDGMCLVIGAAEAAPGLEVSEVPEAELADRLAAICGQALAPHGALFRAHLLRTAEDQAVLALVGHGLVVDRPSLQRVVQEIAWYYRDITGYRSAGEQAEPAAPVPLRRYLEELEGWLGGPEGQAHTAWWLGRFPGGLPRADLLADRLRPAIKAYDGARAALPVPTAGALARWCGSHGCTPFMAIAMLFGLVQRRYSQGQGQDQKTVIGLIGRFEPPGLPAGPLVAGAANPLLLDLPEPEIGAGAGQTVLERLAQARRALLDAYDHPACPFPALVQGLDPARDQSRSALFTVAIEPIPALQPGDWPDLEAEAITPPVRRCRYDLHLRVVEPAAGAGGELEIQCDYSTELFDRASVARWLRALRRLIAALPEQGDGVTVAEFLARHGLEDGERAELLSIAGPPIRPSGAARTLIGRLREQAARTPEAEAIRAPAGAWSYRELQARVLALAGEIRRVARRAGAGGLAPEERVGICMARTPDHIAAFFAVQQAGGAWVPLDPALPLHRIQAICADAGIRQILTDTATRSGLSGLAGLSGLSGLTVWAVDGALDSAPEDTPEDAPDDGAALACVLYTSGSTGAPKGVMVEQRGMVAVVDHALAALPRGAFDGVLASTSFSFDVSGFEIYPALCCGGTILLAQDALALAELPAREAVTLACLVPSVLEAVLEAGLPSRLRWLVIGGEAIQSPELLTRLWRAQPEARVWNGYGPTEDTIYSMFGELRPGDSPRLLHGPLAGSRALVLDGAMGLTPAGAEGELYLGGAGVARGYLNQPGLTAERFVPDPFHPGGRLYRTGDIVRVLGGGRLLYVGRRDHQIKLRGFRIELEEIESCLLRQPGVAEAVVQKWIAPATDQAGGQAAEHLVAWLALSAESAGAGAEAQIAAIRAALAQELPAYMVPSFFVPVAALPKLPNGKLDRRRLPEPEMTRAALSPSGYLAPETPLQQVLAGVWSRVLGVDQVGISDNFFDLGGTSLKMTAMLHAIRHTFQVRPRLRAFFDAPTLGELADHIQQLREATAGSAGGTDGPAELRAEARFEWLMQDAALDPADAPQTPLAPAPAPGGTPRHILLTGATGFVGAHILRELVLRSEATLYCLVRGRDAAEGWRKLRKALISYRLEDALPPEPLEPGQPPGGRIVIVPGDIVLPRLGLGPEDYARLAAAVDCVYHGAAAVNFIYPYHALRAINVEGTREVIRFAFAGQRKPLHYVSTAAIWPMGGWRRFTEDDSIDHNIDLNMGYDESKWVAEKLLASASAQGLPVTIYRPGEVAGHSESGQSVEGHFLFAMLKGCLQIKAFPRLGNWLDLSPVDYCAAAIAHLLLHAPPGQTFHTTNPGPLQVRDLYAWLRHIGYDFEELSFTDWKQQLLSVGDLSKNALYPYVSILEEFEEQNLELPQYDCSRTTAALEGTGIRCAPVAPPLLWRYIEYLAEIGFMELPPGAEG